MPGSFHSCIKLLILLLICQELYVFTERLKYLDFSRGNGEIKVDREWSNLALCLMIYTVFFELVLGLLINMRLQRHLEIHYACILFHRLSFVLTLVLAIYLYYLWQYNLQSQSKIVIDYTLRDTVLVIFQSIFEICVMVLFRFCYNAYRFFSRFKLKTVLLYFLSVSIHAFVLVYVLCAFYTQFLIWINNLPLHLDRYVVYVNVDSLFVPTKIEYNASTYLRTTTMLNQTDGSILVNSQLYKVNKIGGFPKKGEAYKRYKGEDVRFQCLFRLKGDFEDDIFWEQGSKQLSSLSPRHYINITINQESKCHNNTSCRCQWYTGSAELTIFLITAEDFGDYTLTRKIVMTSGWETSFPTILEHTVCTFILHEITESELTIPVPLGGIYFLSNIRYNTYTDEGNVTVARTFQNSEIDSSDIYTLGGCFPSVYLYWMFWLHVNLSSFPSVLSTFDIDNENQTFVKGNVASCMCIDSIGKQQVHFYRNFYNRSTKRIEIAQITHPLQFVLIPKEGSHIFSLTNDSKRHETMFKKIMEKQDEEHFSYMQHSEYYNWLLLFLAETILLPILLFLAVVLLGTIIDNYGTYIVPLCRHALLGRPLMHGPEQINIYTNNAIELKHDVYISYTETDRIFVTQKLVPYLEFTGLRVCVAERDFPPGNNLRNYSIEINRSNKVIVVFSKDYIEDRECRYFQLDCIIMQNVIDGKLPEDHVLLIKYKHSSKCPQLLQRISHLDWGVDLPEKDKLLRVKKFAGETIFGFAEAN